MKLKKIRIDELKVGMFIVNLGRSWFSHPFLRNQLKITSEKQIQKLWKHGIQEVYIDPARGTDIPSPGQESDDSHSPVAQEPGEIPSPPEKLEEAEAHPILGEASPPLPAEAAEASLHRQEKPESVLYWEQNIGRVEGHFSPQEIFDPLSPGEQIPFSREIQLAQAIQGEAQELIYRIMQDIRMGRSIESDRVKRVVNNMVDSVLRNRNALVSLTRMKRYNEYTYVHSLDVCILCISLAHHLSLSRDEMVEIGMGGLLHDVGKMKLPPHILGKKGALNEEEWEEVRKHPIYGLEIMEESGGMPELFKQVAIQHHERCNGTGYPYGLKEEAIGLFGQIAGIVDCYDSVTADRSYRNAVRSHEGIREIYEKSGEEFNRLLVEQFIQCIGIYPLGTPVLLDSEEIGIVCWINPQSLLRPKVLIIHQNMKTPCVQPFVADLMEKAERSRWPKRTIVMPLGAQKLNIRLEAYYSDIWKSLEGQGIF